MFLRRHSAFRRASWLAVFAILLQTLVPLVHRMPTNVGPAGFDLVRNLCMAPVGAPVAPTDKAPIHKLPPCSICQTLQLLGGGFVPPTAVAVAAPAALAAVGPAFADTARLSGREVASLRARGPPASA